MSGNRKCMSVLAAFLFLIVSVLAMQPVNASTPKTELTVTIGTTAFEAELEDNAAVKKLLSKVPATYQMTELNGNEKYKYLDYDLPTKEEKVGQIQAGDIMLYGSDCIVIFYQSFATEYSYTRLGRIRDTAKLKTAVGTGEVKVTFSLKDTSKKTVLNKKKLTLDAGKSFKLRLKNGKTKKVSWSSSNRKVATVSKKGTVKAKKAGTATIIAKYKKKTYKCKIRVRGN